MKKMLIFLFLIINVSMFCNIYNYSFYIKYSDKDNFENNLFNIAVVEKYKFSYTTTGNLEIKFEIMPLETKKNEVDTAIKIINKNIIFEESISIIKGEKKKLCSFEYEKGKNAEIYVSVDGVKDFIVTKPELNFKNNNITMTYKYTSTGKNLFEGKGVINNIISFGYTGDFSKQYLSAGYLYKGIEFGIKTDGNEVNFFLKDHTLINKNIKADASMMPVTYKDKSFIVSLTGDMSVKAKIYDEIYLGLLFNCLNGNVDFNITGESEVKIMDFSFILSVDIDIYTWKYSLGVQGSYIF